MIAFFDPLIRKHVTHAMCRNSVATFLENTVYARFTQELLQLIFKINF